MRGETIRWPEPAGQLAQWGIVFLICGLFAGGCAAFSPKPSSKNQDKATDLYRFGQFVEWPAYALPPAKKPVVIGILGGNPFGDKLAKISKGGTINGHPVTVRWMSPFSDLKRCQILFINRSAKFRLPLIFHALEGGHVLTVSDMDGFLEAGGMVQFVTEGERVRFKINQPAVEKAGLKMSSQMLKMAEWPQDEH